MQYPKVKPRASKESLSPGVYSDLDELIRLQFKVHRFSFLPRQPVQRLLASIGVVKVKLFAPDAWMEKILMERQPWFDKTWRLGEIEKIE